MVVRNLLTFVAALVIGVVITSAVYHRFWEKFTPFEPPHGAPKLSLSNPASFTGEWGTPSVRLPDGRIWTGSLSPGLSLANFKMELTGGEYVSGTNWLSLEHSYFSYTAGLKRDGTLWVSKNPPPRHVAQDRLREIKEDELHNLVQFGSESNWASILLNYDSLLLVKKDGTLWRLGQPDYSHKNNNRPWPGLLAFEPQRLGTESNWAKVFLAPYQICLLKTDGSCWVAWENWQTNIPSIEIEPGFVVHRVPALDHDQMRSTAYISIGQGLPLGVGVRADGTFRIWADHRVNPNHRSEWQWALTDRQIGTGTNWLAVAGDGDKVVTLKNDGTLWLWNFRYKPARVWSPSEEEIVKTVPVRLGTHSDWIDISVAPNMCVVALAADGSLWFWPLVDINELASDENGGEHWEPLLDISHKPQFLANVFSVAN